jgi:hypothetical protein
LEQGVTPPLYGAQKLSATRKTAGAIIVSIVPSARRPRHVLPNGPRRTDGQVARDAGRHIRRPH